LTLVAVDAIVIHIELRRGQEDEEVKYHFN
jgi:hypothetical protein